MVEYLTKYPKTVSFVDVVCGSLKGIVSVKKDSSVEQLHIVVKKNANELFKMFSAEGFTKIKFEHKQPSQIELEYLLNPPLNNIIIPHGGHLVQQLILVFLLQFFVFGHGYSKVLLCQIH